MSETTIHLHRAANVAVLYELDRAGYLTGLTLQEIANLMGMGHRSTALRAMRDVEVLKKLLPELKGKLAARRLPLAE